VEEKDKNGDADKNSRQCIVLYHTFPGDIYFPGFEKMKKSASAVEAGSLQEIDIK
jgi:hypothetical protein